MIVTVASGKGGTGKTTVAVALAWAASSIQSGTSAPCVQLLDCDVEEPNAHLFLKPTIEARKEVGILTPVVDRDRCGLSRRCAEVCAYNAIAVLGKEVLVFDELCHGCGSCALACPEHAIREELRVIGMVEEGIAGGIAFAQGILNVGEAMAGPVIRQVKRQQKHSASLVVRDAPPGTSCPVVETLRGSDYALMVTEPTPFGLHDLRMAVEVARKELGLPVGVVINRDGVGDYSVVDYCLAQEISILMSIPLDRRIAEAASNGTPLPVALPEYQQKFLALYRRLLDEVEV